MGVMRPRQQSGRKRPPAEHAFSRRATGRAALFRCLARYCQAGITLDRGLDQWARQLPRHRRGPYRLTAQWLQAGQTLAAAGLRSGILQPWEAGLLATVAMHGRLDRALDDLADYHERATDWWNRLRLRLLFPAGILLLGLLVLPLPGLATGQVSLQAYLLLNLLPAASMVALRGRLKPGRGWHRLADRLLRLQTLGKPLRQVQRRRFLYQLACLYRAGVPVQDALPVAVENCDSALLRRRWSAIAATVSEGSGLSKALHQHGAVDDTGYALLLGGETSGRPGEMLDREVHRLEQHIALWRESLVDWLPRLAYVAVLLLLLSL